MLQLVYADKSPPDPPLISRIVEATQHPGALDAFTSIVLSPKVRAPHATSSFAFSVNDVGTFCHLPQHRLRRTD